MFVREDLQGVPLGAENTYWKSFCSRNAPGEKLFTSLTKNVDVLEWYHAAEVFIASILSRSPSFRDAFRSFTEKLESGSSIGSGERTSRQKLKRHKIFPLVFSFLTEAMASDSTLLPT